MRTTVRAAGIVGRAIISTLVIFVVGGMTTACGGSSSSTALQAETASFDVAAGEVARLMVGVSDIEGNSLTGGTVFFRIRPVDGEWSSPVPARSLGVPGRPNPSGDEPRLTAPSEAVGVYATEKVTIPAAGFWEVEVDAGKLGKAITAFEAHDRAQAVAVGQPAPKTKNPTVNTPGIKPSQLDSLALDATDLAALRHPELYQVEIAAALQQRRPLAIVVATPAFCTSQFCGPLVDEFAKLRTDYPNVAFVHLEVFPDGFDKPVSVSAAQWIAEGGTPAGEGNEPWVFVVDSSGTVTQRWDNVIETDKLRAELQRLNG
jgi:hypothetical protein